jgi:ribonuclease HII
MTFYESRLQSQGITTIAGLDEAGRGPLAGPVVACCIIYHPGLLIEGLNDSKLLTPLKRGGIYDQIISHKDTNYALGIVEAQEIDKINILQATFLAMKEAANGLKDLEYILIDGNQLPNLPLKSEGIIKGDQKSITIAAASIIAKETRDKIMLEHHKTYPEYAFSKHKGYGTKIHKEALEKYGPCPIHRKSFAPIAKYFT